MAERKGLVARWLEGKERSEEYARSTLPTNRWSLFWDIFKGRFGKLVIVNLLVLVTFLPIVALFIWRYAVNLTQGVVGPYGAGLGVGYPTIPNVVGVAEMSVFQSDLFFNLLFIVGAAIAAIGISGGMYVIRNMIWTEGIFVANDFLRGVKRNYLNVLEALLVFTLINLAVSASRDLSDVSLALGTASSWVLVAGKVMGYLLFFFAALVCLWMISLGINYKQGVWTLFRNAVVMTVGTFPQTIFFAFLAILPFLLLLLGSFFMALGLILVLLFGFSFAMLVWMDYSQWAFDRFINPKIGVATGRGIYNKEKASMNTGAADSAAIREYKRMIVAQGKSKLVCRPIKPIDDGLEVYQLPDSFSREYVRRLRESKQAIEEDAAAYEEEHKNEERYVEYNKQFEEREKALQEEGKKGKKKAPKPPKMLNKR